MFIYFYVQCDGKITFYPITLDNALQNGYESIFL